MSTKKCNRITLFKIPVLADQEKLLAIYKEMPNNAKKVYKYDITNTVFGPLLLLLLVANRLFFRTANRTFCR
jgi:hypothetical protein